MEFLPCFVKLTAIAILISMSASQSPPTEYVNHTVGGTVGWSFNSTTNTSATNYTDWASKLSFNLGDYLIFNTTSEQDIIQTYNKTTYNNCLISDASDADTSVYSGGELQNKTGIIAIPLTIEGENYYFSSTNDGIYCLNGMAFEIQVGHGLGLPPSLNQPPPPPYDEPPESPPPVSVSVPIIDPKNGGPNARLAAPCYMLALLVVLFGYL